MRSYKEKIILGYENIPYVHIFKMDVKKEMRGDLQDSGGVRRGDHLPPHKYIRKQLHVEQLLQDTY